MSRKPRKPKANAADKAIGQRIKYIRTELSVSQEQLGKALGITFQQIQKYENGHNRISASQLKVAADFLGVPITWFLEHPKQDGEALFKAWEALPKGLIRERIIALMQAVGRLA